MEHVLQAYLVPTVRKSSFVGKYFKKSALYIFFLSGDDSPFYQLVLDDDSPLFLDSIISLILKNKNLKKDGKF